MTHTQQRPLKWIRRLALASALLGIAAATAGSAGAGAVGGPEYGIVRVEADGVNDCVDWRADDRVTETDACLRAHGWLYGSLALRKMALRVGHPNGLRRVCYEQVHSRHRAAANRVADFGVGAK
jgi:hypothetical protein